MTHSSHRFATLSADDVALCRAHSRAVASEPDYVLWARVTDTKASLAELNRNVAYRAACDDFERVTLNQAQSDAYWQWQREVHAPVTIGFDLGAPEGDTTVIALASAKPAAQHPEPTIKVGDTVMTKYDGLATVISLGSGELTGEVATVRLANGYEGCTSVAGLKRISQLEPAARLASTSSAADGAALIGANPAVPAQQPAQKASTHSVCIRAHKSLGFNRDIGTVLPMLPHHRSHPEYWLPCDESGWVTHVPTADSVCPVPEGLDFAAMWNDGEVSGLVSRYFREHVNTWRSNHMSAGLRAWRPIAQS